MTATQYNQALKISTMAAIKGGVSLHEVVGMLELAKGNVLRMALNGLVTNPNIVQVDKLTPPGEPG